MKMDGPSAARLDPMANRAHSVCSSIENLSDKVLKSGFVSEASLTT
jgi:hypothetical protein